MRGWSATLGAAVLAVALAGCGGTTSNPGAGGTSPSSGAGPTPAGSSAPASSAPGSSSPGSSSPGGSSPGGIDAASVTALTVTLRASATATATKETVLLCDGAAPQAGSTVADPAAACAAVVKAGVQGFAPQAARTGASGTACTMQMGAPTIATVEGTVAGEPVNATFTQHNGCAIARWDALAPLFGGEAGTR